MILRNQKPVKALPFPVYYWPAFLLSVGGIADSIYLSISHYRVYTDIGYSSFCAISKSINCDTVSQSPFSIFLNVPVPVWGIWGYALFTLLLWTGRAQWQRQKIGWALLQLIALLFTVYSIILAFISTYYIHSYCIMCIISYGINLLLLLYIWIIRKRFNLPGFAHGLREDIVMIWRNSAIRYGGGFLLLIAVLMVLAFPSYWQYDAELPLTALNTGTTEDGHPWIGATDPEIEIVEYTDYLCFQCRKMHHYLRSFIARYPEKVRLIHRHFPMDHAINPLVKEPFHVGSGQMALLALYAAEKGRFWQMNDALFQFGGDRGELNLRDLSNRTGVDLAGMRKSLTARTDLQMRLAKDIWAGMKLDITGTPAYVIDGVVHLAVIPPAVFRKVMPQ